MACDAFLAASSMTAVIHSVSLGIVNSDGSCKTLSPDGMPVALSVQSSCLLGRSFLARLECWHRLKVCVASKLLSQTAQIRMHICSTVHYPSNHLMQPKTVCLYGRHYMSVKCSD